MNKEKAYINIKPKNEYWLPPGQLRATTGMSRQKVADIAGVHVNTVEKFETQGMERMVLGTLRKIVNAMGYDLVVSIKERL